MAYAWSPDLETGNTAIDNQHKQLIAAVNDLFDAHQHGKGRQEVERTMEFLVGYTIKHFADEGKLQEKYDYPDYLIHKQAHTNFKAVAQELTKKLSKEGPTDELIRNVYVTVGEWLVNHIKGDDFKMATYVRSKEQEEQGA
jgi:hemerythrin